MPIQQYWIIQGYDSTTKIFQDKVKYGCFTEKAMKDLLRALTAKYSLEDEEIVRAFAKIKTKIALPLLLEIRKSYNPSTLSCGSNPYFTARIIDEE